MNEIEAALRPPWDLDATEHPLVKLQVKTIANEIFSRIVSGEYSFGTRIPPERELAIEFEASRGTIRQALDFLESYGAVARRAGSGTFITFHKPTADTETAADPEIPGYINIRAIVETASPFEMNVAVHILEPEMVRLATIYMSTRDLQKLSSIIKKLEAIVTEAEEFIELETEFLITLAEGTHNLLILAMYRILHEVRRQPEWSTAKKQSLTPARIRDSQRRLRSLYDALERRKVESAVEFMRLHVASTQDDMIYTS
jgi:DNA-binding FadR family transcriptional regulator